MENLKLLLAAGRQWMQTICKPTVLGLMSLLRRRCVNLFFIVPILSDVDGGTRGQWRYDYFHGDIMLCIFSRLTIESILECRQVCKTWRNLLPPMDNNENTKDGHNNYSYFVDPHLQYFHLQYFNREVRLLNQQLDNSHAYEDDKYGCLANATDKMSLVFMGDSNDKDKHPSLYHVEYNENNDRSYTHTRTFSISLPSETPLTTVGSCNGLVCLTTKISEYICERVYICNPITRECVELPRLFENNNEYRDSGIRQPFYGFGYVPSTNKYKVVRIIDKLNSNGHIYAGEVQVYTIGDPLKKWRDKREIRPLYNRHGLHVNGALHWDVCPGQHLIASFDLLDEEFSFIKYPPDNVPPINEWGEFHLAILGGRLCVLLTFSSCSEVWVLNKKNKVAGISEVEEQEHYSWTKKLTVPMNLGTMYRPFAIFKSGQILLWCKEKTVVGYDLETSTATELGDVGMARPKEDPTNLWAWKNYDKAVVHSNSFVSLRRIGENARILDMITD